MFEILLQNPSACLLLPKVTKSNCIRMVVPIPLRQWCLSIQALETKDFSCLLRLLVPRDEQIYATTIGAAPGSTDGGS